MRSSGAPRRALRAGVCVAAARRIFGAAWRAADAGCVLRAAHNLRGAAEGSARGISRRALAARLRFFRGARRGGEAAAFGGARRLWLNFRAWLTIAAGIMNFAALKGACL